MQAGGSSTFHAECIKVPVNCALRSQGGLGKAPLGLVLLGGPAGESIPRHPRRQPPGAPRAQGGGPPFQPLPPPSCSPHPLPQPARGRGWDQAASGGRETLLGPRCPDFRKLTLMP